MRGSSCTTEVFIFVIMESKRQTGDKGAQQSTTNVFILFLEQKVVREREKLVETNTMDRGMSERVTETSQGGNKKHIDWPCQSEAVNEGGRRRRGGLDSCRLGSREGNGERKWVSIKLCQGQFAVNGPLHLDALSQRGCWRLGASMNCMLGGAHLLKRQAQRQSITIIIHITVRVLSC